MTDRIFRHCLKALFTPISKGICELQNDDASMLISIVEYFIEFPGDLPISSWLKLLESYWWLYDNYMCKIKEELGDKYRKSLLEMYMMSADLALLAKYSQETVYCEHFIWCAGLFSNMWYPFMTDRNNDISEEEKKDFLMTTKHFSKRTCPYTDMSVLNSLCTYHTIDILDITEITIHPKSQIVYILLNEGGLSSIDFDRLYKSPMDSLTDFFIEKCNEFNDYDSDKQLITPEERLDVEKCARILKENNVPTSYDDFGDVLYIIRTHGLQEISEEENDSEEEEEEN